MSKAMRVLFAVIAVCLLALTGCGGSTSTETETSPPAAETTPAEEPTSAEPTEAETTEGASEEPSGEAAAGGTVGTPLGVAETDLGEIVVETGQAAEFATMTPHSIGTVGEPVELLTIFDADGERAHQRSGGTED